MLSNSNFSFLKAIASATLVFSTLYAGSASADLDNPVMSTGYANVFDTGGGYQFGSGWAVGDLKATVDGNTVTLQPNFNAYDPADVYWSNGAVGNKIFEANLFDEVVPTPVGTGTYTFSGYVDSNTLDSGYSAVAFIKIVENVPPYATLLNETVSLPSGSFSVSADVSAYEGVASNSMQIGFQVKGLNANPADEAALGSVALRIGASGVSGGPGGDVTGIPVLPLWALFGLAGLIGLMGLRRKA